MSDPDYHTATPESDPPTRVNVWHDNDNCPEGKRITQGNRRAGRGNASRRCELC
jgi:hypothetical protein